MHTKNGLYLVLNLVVKYWRWSPGIEWWGKNFLRKKRVIFFVGFVVSKCQRWPNSKRFVYSKQVRMSRESLAVFESGVDCGWDGHVSRGCTVRVVSGWCRAPFPSHNRVSCCVVLEHWVLVTKRRMRNPLTPGNNGRPCPTRPSRLYNTAALARLLACLLYL